ncbi:hypothetical protein AGOR_G00017260 [Albula goreensis]|uniref:Secreted protein n=1 Tax=Albula goreensis TaxID=1534307 RepID=A0A8T3E029_9TELE|nr:hypothetical protein AGOR_G00017260 [Albula goreensis]
MNVKILTLVIVLLVSLLCSASAGPMASTEPGRQLEEEAGVRKLGPCLSRPDMIDITPPPSRDFYALPLP